ncbi:hypothetical protein IPF86_01430 [Candidatus Nomurabacteria bacterium]|nr:MAG: hypothetical protein IPF86_01430 [Candidatus Nomurabacteria bacterium]
MIHSSEKEIGLSSGNRSFIVGMVFVALFLFGPVEPYGFLVRIAYLIIFPSLVWLILYFWGRKWGMDKLSNDRLWRALIAIVAGVLLVQAYFSFNAKYHSECAQRIQTRDGSECVGDYVTVKGPNIEGGFLEIIFAGFAIWLAVSKRSERED